MKKTILFALALAGCLSAGAQITDSEYKSVNLTNMELKSWLTDEAGSMADTVNILHAIYVNNYEVDTFLYYYFVNNELIEKKDDYINTEEAQFYSWWFGGYKQTYEDGHTVISLSGSVSSKTPFSFNTEKDTTYAAFVGKGEFFANSLNNYKQLPLVFTSSNPKAVKVNAETGAIEVMGVGQTTITASYDGQAGKFPAYQTSYTMTVVNRPFDDYEFVDFDNLETNDYNYYFQRGSYSYDPETYTLTLDNYYLVSSEYMWFQFFTYAVSRPSPIPLTVYVKGDCKIVSRGGAIQAGADMVVCGDKDATLAMYSYVPPVEAKKFIVDGINLSLSSESHPNFAGDLFQINNGSYVHLQEYAYFSGERDHIMQLLFGDLKMDSEIGILTKGVHYGTEDIMQYDEMQTVTTFFFSDNTIAPVVEIGKVQRPKPLTNKTEPVQISMEGVEVEYNPAGTDIDGIFYTITEDDKMISEEGCLEIVSTMGQIEMQQIAGIFSSPSLALAQNFRGISFLLPAGEGEITLDALTLGTHQLGVKIGEEETLLYTLDERRTVKVEYDIAEPQLVFIYGYVEPSEEEFYTPCRAVRRAPMENDGSVKLYGLTISPKKIVTGVEDVELNGKFDSSNAQINKIFRDGQVLLLRDGKTYTLFGSEVQ